MRNSTPPLSVKYGAAEPFKPARMRVHEQEGKIVEHVDAGQVGVELDRVERRRPVIEQADVPKVQVAMAGAHLACRARPIRRSSNAVCARKAALARRVHLQTASPPISEAWLCRLPAVMSIARASPAAAP